MMNHLSKCGVLIKMVGTWKRLAHITSDSASAEVTTGTFTAKENLKVELYYTGTGTGDAFINFNGDETGNYANRYVRDGGSDGTPDTSQSIGLRLQQGTTTPQFSVINIKNILNKEKLVIGHTITQGSSTSSNAPTRQEFVGKWVNTSAQITEITLDRASDNFASGSSITVWGASDDVVTDEKTTLADATVTTSPTPTPTSSGGTLSPTSSGSTVLATTALGFTASNTWVLRFSTTFSSYGNNTYWLAYVANSDAGDQTSQNGIGSNWKKSSGVNTFGVHSSQNAQPYLSNPSDSQTISPDSSSKYYWEIIRLGDTSAKVNYYGTDSTYGTISSTSANTSISNATGLDRIKFFSGSSTNGSRTIAIADVKFYNGITAVTSTTSSLAPAINTRYEEVDTRKIYRWADSTDKTNIYNYWKMDSSTNTDTATTSNGYTNGLGKNGTNSNITVSTSDKKIGTASYEFNGSSSKCTYGSTSDWKFLHNGDAWSATFWMKLDSLAGGEILGTMAGNSGSETGMHFYVHPDSNGMWTMQVFGGSSGNYPLNSNVSNVLTTGTWNHYACTFDGSTTYTVYKDGVSKGTMTKGSASFSSSNSTYTLHMGDSGGNSDELDGKLDDFALWKTELSASFIKELYEGSATDNITGWKERGS